MSTQLIHDRLTAALGGQQRFPFILLAGPSDTGKRDVVTTVAHEQLGQYVMTDLLHVRDMTAQLGKTHTLPVRQPSGEAKRYQLDNGSLYDNIGSREIRDRLSHSPHGDSKIVVIENIERATISAANALLKHLEEPLPGRYIVATTSSPDDVLPTLHSRALMLHMDMMDTRDMVRLLVTEYGLSQPQAKTIARMSADKILRARQLAVRDDRQNLIDVFYSLQDKITHKKLIPLLQTFRSIDQAERSLYYDALLQDAIDAGSYGIVDALIRYRQYRSRNVHAESSLLQLVIDVVASD